MSDLRDIAVKYAHLLDAPDYSQMLNEADEIERLCTDNAKLLARPLFRENRELSERIDKLEAALETIGTLRIQAERVLNARIAELEDAHALERRLKNRFISALEDLGIDPDELEEAT